MLLMRTFSSADTSADDCLSETLSSAWTTSGRERRSVVLAQSQLMPCVGDADPADASENGRERGTSRWSSNVTFSGSNSSGVGGGKRRSLMASTWFPRRRGSLLLGHLVGQGFRGGCAVVAGGDLEYCSWSTTPPRRKRQASQQWFPAFDSRQLGSFGEDSARRRGGAAEGSEGVEDGE